MSNNGVIQCKVKLLAEGELQEMRRFQLDDASFASSFDLFREKLRAVFPQLRDAAFKVTWTDADGDVITIGNDEDLLMAMLEMNGVKILDVHLGGVVSDEPELEGIHPFGSVVTCDVCNARITRYRYKCLQCHDYDLCSACEQAGNHAHHVMMRLANLEIPRGLPKMLGHFSRSARKAAHHVAREAHRCARNSARAAHSAAASAAATATGVGKCPFRERADCQGKGARSAPHEAPLLDTGVLYDLAAAFLGPFAQAAGHAQAPQAQAHAQTPPGGATPTQPTGTDAAGQTAGAPNANVAPADVIGNILRNVFGTINSSVGQHASGASPPAGPTTTSAQTPVATPATPAPAPTEDTINIDLTNTNPSVPMEVEQPVATAPIYPPLTKSPVPDERWTILGESSSHNVRNTQAATAAHPPAPIVAPAIPVAQVSEPRILDEMKYATQLGQLRRMGFSDHIDLLSLLKQYDGKVGMVVNHLFEHSN